MKKNYTTIMFTMLILFLYTDINIAQYVQQVPILVENGAV